ncbi:hypothetical protein KC351_g130, partial [Hortaea werneckii]
MHLGLPLALIVHHESIRPCLNFPSESGTSQFWGLRPSLVGKGRETGTEERNPPPP